MRSLDKVHTYTRLSESIREICRESERGEGKEEPHTLRRSDTSSHQPSPCSQGDQEGESEVSLGQPAHVHANRHRVFSPLYAHIYIVQVDRLERQQNRTGTPFPPARCNQCRRNCTIQRSTPSTGSSGSLPRGVCRRGRGVCRATRRPATTVRRAGRLAPRVVFATKDMAEISKGPSSLPAWAKGSDACCCLCTLRHTLLVSVSSDRFSPHTPDRQRSSVGVCGWSSANWWWCCRSLGMANLCHIPACCRLFRLRCRRPFLND